MGLIDQMHLHELFQTYKNLSALKIDKLELSEENFITACQFIESQAPEIFDWENLRLNEKEADPLLIRILTKCFKNTNQQLVFEPHSAQTALIANQIHYLRIRELSFLQPSAQLGIQEKFLNSQLVSTEPLNAIDVRRLLLHTEMNTHIHLCDLHAEQLGLILSYERLQHQHNTEPYAVAVMININTAKNDSPQWVSVVAQVNPLQNSVQYHIESEKPLQNNEQDIILNGLTYSFNQEHTAFPKPITMSGKFQTIQANAETPSNGYKIIHRLFNHPDLHNVILHPAALELKTSEAQVHAIRRAIYKIELQAIQLSAKTSSIFEQKIQDQFTNGIITPEALNQQVSFDLKPQTSEVQHPSVTEKISEIQLYQDKISFVTQSSPGTLNNIDYYVFLLLLNDKFKQIPTPQPLQELVLDGCTQALNALCAFGELSQPVPFKILTLDLSTVNLTNPASEEHFFYSLKSMMLSLSHANNFELHFNDPQHQLSESLIEKIALFVKERPVGLHICLPEKYQSTTIQQSIDQHSSDHIHQKNLRTWANPSAVITQEQSINKERRQRPKPSGKQEVSIDIELQQEQQAEVAVESTTSTSSTPDLIDTERNTAILDFDAFQNALATNQLSEKSQLFLVDCTPQNASRLWTTWLGQFSDIEAREKNSLKLSKSACEELLTYQQQFQYGLDLQRLPAGFYKATHESSKQTYIDFDPKLKRIAVLDPLAVQLTESTNLNSLAHSQFKSWINANNEHPIARIWNDFEKHPYDRKAHQLFKNYLPQMLELSDAQLDTVFKLCITETGALNSESFDFLLQHAARMRTVVLSDPDNNAIHSKLERLFSTQAPQALEFVKNYTSQRLDFNNHLLYQLTREDSEASKVLEQIRAKVSDLNWNALTQIYLRSGSHGLIAFNKLIDYDPELFKHLHTHALSKNNSYLALIEPQFKDTLEAIQGFSPSERLWWNHLFEQHAAVHSQMDVNDLVNAFKQFKDHINQVSTSDAHQLTFPKQCRIEGINSLPVALSRMLAIMEQQPMANASAQWNEIDTLDLSSNGVIKALTMQGIRNWAFFTAEMKLNAKSECLNLAHAKEYSVDRNWKMIAGLDLNQVIPRFFRFVGYQNNNEQLPLPFYRHAHERIQQAKLSEEVKTYIYKLLASATTDAKNIKNTGSLAQTINDFDLLLDKIIKTPAAIPSVLENQFRLSILESLVILDNAPPLPILSRLVSLISSVLNNPLTLISNVQKLEQANDKLKNYNEFYGSSVYQGMKDYSNEDYKRHGLFFSHMNILDKIVQQSGSDDDALNQKRYLIKGLFSIVSTFNLEIEDIETLYQDIFNESTPQKHFEAFYILEHLTFDGQDKKPARLNAQDLSFIFNTIDQNLDANIIEVMKDITLPSSGLKLASYLPRDFIENYGKKSLSINIITQIKAHFNEAQQAQISNLLLRFTGPTDAMQHEKLLNLLIAICEPLSALDKNIFIAKLIGTPDLYSNPLPLDDEHNSFVQLLQHLNSHKSTNEFINIVAAERQLLDQSTAEQKDLFFIQASPQHHAISHLDKKSILYLRTLLPAIKNWDNTHLSQLDLNSRLMNVLFLTPAEQLEQQSSIEREEYLFFTKLETKLTSTQDNLDKGQAINLHALLASSDVLASQCRAEPNEFLNAYTANLHDKSKFNLDQKNIDAVIKNPEFELLKKIIVDPDSVGMIEKVQLYIHKDGIEKSLEKYPGIMIHHELISSLFANPQFLSSLTKPETLKIAQDKGFLRDTFKRDLYFAALEKDLKQFAEFKKQTAFLKIQLTKHQASLASYPSVFNHLFQKINQLVGDNPSSKTQFLALFDRFLQDYIPQKHGELLQHLVQFVDVLQHAFAQTTNKNMVLSLCLQFNHDSDPELTPERLVQLLTTIKQLPQALQNNALQVAVALINNDKEYQLESFSRACTLMGDDPHFAQALAVIYKRAPYPTLHQVFEWHKLASNAEDYQQTLNIQLEQFDKAPAHREAENGFHVEKACTQIAQFEVNGSYPAAEEQQASVAYFQQFHDLSLQMRDKSVDQLLSILHSFKGQHPNQVDNKTLVAVAAELLHRSKARDEQDANGEFKMGSSMEINTTQYLSLLTMLNTPGHVTSQIGTGEGKSRIMMISLACQYALGKTVDFVTSDAQLATRDYVEFQSYFDLIGAKTSMIFAHTDPAQYQKGGINFSDPSNLSLFRNKARSNGQAEAVVDSNLQNRALLLDEADKTYFDVANTRFNFSKEGDDSIRGMEWIYPLLIDYFNQESVTLAQPVNDQNTISPQALYYEDVDLSREKFLQYASSNCTREQLARLKALPNVQIEQWQVSAVTANELKFKEDFVIEANCLINTASGPKISSEAQLLFANRVSKSSKFSFGVHQCLHARLNRYRQHPTEVTNPELLDKLSLLEHAFHIADEKQIVYSSTSKNLLDDYREGTLKAVTGTAGSLIERQEAAQLYGASTELMQFIMVPRDKGLNRRDKAIYLSTNEKNQLKKLVEQIKEAKAKEQPILIIAQDDQESESLFKALQEHFLDTIQHIHSQLSLADEKKGIDKAGMPGQITVSTDMIGRGTDIALRGTAKNHGLNVMVTYLPRVRDLEQIIGRAGRFGAKGETSLVLNKKRLKQDLGKTALGSAYYRNVEAYIEREQALMDRNKQCERLIKNTVGDFRKTLTDNFFEGMLKQLNPQDYTQFTTAWAGFFDKSDKLWNEQWPHIQHELAAPEVDLERVNNLLTEYQNQVSTLWNKLRSTVQDLDVLAADGTTKAIAYLDEHIPTLHLNDTTRKLLKDFDISAYAQDQMTTYSEYDAGHAGRAVTYKSWYTPLVASIKGYANILPFVRFENARPPFANFRAWLNGTGQLFPNLRAFLNSLWNAIKQFFGSTQTVLPKIEETSTSQATFFTQIIKNTTSTTPDPEILERSNDLLTSNTVPVAENQLQSSADSLKKLHQVSNKHSESVSDQEEGELVHADELPVSVSSATKLPKAQSNKNQSATASAAQSFSVLNSVKTFFQTNEKAVTSGKKDSTVHFKEAVTNFKSEHSSDEAPPDSVSNNVQHPSHATQYKHVLGEHRINTETKDQAENTRLKK